MTRKDYIAIAAALTLARADVDGEDNPESLRDLRDGINYAAKHIADALARDNSRFDRARFLKAAGVTA